MADTSRRRFLAAAATVAGGIPWLRPAAGMQEEPEAESRKNETLPTIELGSTGRVVPRLGLGAAMLARLKSEESALEVIKRAFDRGVRYLDTAPSYSRGRSENLLGQVLQEYDREDFFIATKTLERDGAKARKDLEASLKRLKVDHVDLLQVHALNKNENGIFGDDAVLKSLEKAREEGLIKHIGITCHKNPRYLIEVTARYDFATALVPVNPLDTKHFSFTRDFLPVAKKRNIPVIAMKVFAAGNLLKDSPLTVRECLHYALSQEQVAVVVPGCDAVSQVDEVYAAAIDFKPLSSETQADIENRAGEHKGKDSEWYKEP